MYDKTRETTVPGEIQVWAVPKTRHEMECEVEQGIAHPVPFSFRLSTVTLWTDGAVKLYTTDISVVCPGGIDLLASALNTLREAKEEETKTFNARIAELDQKINALAVLVFIPEEEV
jgi:hypothetical protein